MDIVWHTHQVNPLAYANDTIRLLDHILPHDDSVNDRNPGSKLCNSQDVTERLWKKEFGEDFSRSGSMFRGLPPQGKLLEIAKHAESEVMDGTDFNLFLKDLEVRISSQDEAKMGKLLGRLNNLRADQEFRN